MAIKIFVDKDTFQSVMYDDIKEYAFGPVFGTDEDPQDFLEWYDEEVPEGFTPDVRKLHPSTLSKLVDNWRKEVEENENEARAERVYSDTTATTLNEQMENSRKVK